jgi:hypothetical protein
MLISRIDYHSVVSLPLSSSRLKSVRGYGAWQIAFRNELNSGPGNPEFNALSQFNQLCCFESDFQPLVETAKPIAPPAIAAQSQRIGENLILLKARAIVVRYGERREHCPVADGELLKDVMKMHFDSAVSNVEPAPNFLV